MYIVSSFPQLIMAGSNRSWLQISSCRIFLNVALGTRTFPRCPLGEVSALNALPKYPLMDPSAANSCRRGGERERVCVCQRVGNEGVSEGMAMSA